MDIGGYEWVFWIVWYVVFVDGDVGVVQSGVSFFIGQVFIYQIQQEQVVFSIVRYYFVVVVQEYFYYCFSVFCNLLLVNFKFWFYCFFQCYCFCCDNVYQWVVLCVWEYGRVQFFVQFFVIVFCQNQVVVWICQGFVSGGGYNVSMWNWVWVYVSGNQVCYVCYIDEQVSVDVVSDFMYFCLVNDIGVSGEIIDDYFWFVFLSLFCYVVIVNFIGFINIVRDDVVQFVGEVNWGVVSQVVVLCQVYIEYGVVWLQQCGVDGKVSLGVGVWLDVSIVSVEQFFCVVDCQLFNYVDVFIVVVVMFVWIFFSIFVGQLRVLCLYNVWIGVVFGGDQFDVFFLMYFFLFYSLLQFGIIIGNVYFMF